MDRSLAGVRGSAGLVITGLLDFARSGARPDPGARTDVREVVAEVASEVDESAEHAGIDLQWEAVPPVLVSADGTVAMGGYPWAPTLDGGFTVLELPSRDEAIAWAARIAKACRCNQELRVFGFDPQS